MSLILSGTDGLSDVDGTAATPAIRGTDTNTGIFFPAADTIAFATAGTEDMRITSTGDVGIGTSSPSGILDARGNVFLGSTSGQFSTFIRSTTNWNFSNLNIIRNAANTSTPRLLSMMLDGDAQDSTTIGAYNAIWGAYDSSPTTGSTSSALNGAMVYGAFAGHRWVTNGTERMRITSAGDVGIGTSAPGARFEIQQNQATNSFFDYYNTTAGGGIVWRQIVRNIANTGNTSVDIAKLNGGAFLINNNDTNAANYTAFGVGGSERARIDSSGNLLVGTTSSNGARLQVSGNATFSSLVYFPGAYNQTTGNPANAHIASDGNLFRSTSSRKYKRDIENAYFGLSELLMLRPVTYKGKSESDGDLVFGGLIAEEVHEAGLTEFVQYAEDGSPDALAYGNMVSLCIKAIQELKAELDTVKTELAALKGTA